nr:hypothetical protein [Paracoccaceae bacterium]
MTGLRGPIAVLIAVLVVATLSVAPPLAGVARADGPWLSAKAFRAWTEGRVIRTVQGSDGTLFGNEAFGPDGAVVWQYPDGTCLTGRWQAI